jgi:hypothetical protein
MQIAYNERRIQCEATLEGTFHSRTISKVSGSLIGYVTSAFIGPTANCFEGVIAILRETLPWHVRFWKFQGALPSITGVFLEIVNLSMSITPTGMMTCLLRGDPVAGPTSFIAELEGGGTGRVVNFRPIEILPIILTGGGGLCSAFQAEISRSGNFARPRTTTRLFFRLVA